MASESPALSIEMVEFLESGVSVLIGTTDQDNRPAGARAIGLKVREDRRAILAFVPVSTGDRTIANARTTKRAAVNFTRPVDYRSLQIKGAVLSVRDATLDERPLLEKYVSDYAAHVELVGLPRALSEKLSYWPSVAIEVAIETMFVQTPGPSAGNPMPRGST